MSPKALSKKLCEQGAVLHIIEHDIDLLVGHWECLDAHRIFFFEAWAENEFGGHLLEFQTAIAPHNLGVEFRDATGAMLAYLTTIEEAVRDARPYRNGWQTWMREAERHAAFIRKVKGTLTHTTGDC